MGIPSQPRRPRIQLTIEFSRKSDGRWTATIPIVSGVKVCTKTRHEASCLVRALALHVLSGQVDASQLKELRDRWYDVAYMNPIPIEEVLKAREP